jgi:hypothetical protein
MFFFVYFLLLCIVSLSKLFVYCFDLDEDQIKFYDQFMLESRFFQRVNILFLANVYIVTYSRSATRVETRQGLVTDGV